CHAAPSISALSCCAGSSGVERGPRARWCSRPSSVGRVVSIGTQLDVDRRRAIELAGGARRCRYDDDILAAARLRSRSGREGARGELAALDPGLAPARGGKADQTLELALGPGARARVARARQERSQLLERFRIR